MWIYLGVGAVVVLGLNIMFCKSNTKSEIFRYISLSLTSLTVCDLYAQNKIWVLKEDWGALMDVVPTVSTMLWVLVAVSIIVNGITLYRR